MLSFIKNKKSFFGLILSVPIFVIAIVGVLLVNPSTSQSTRYFIESTEAHLSLPVTAPFPDIQTKNLSDTQKRIIIVSKIEYQKYPISFDANVLGYTQDNKESWCADYVSWVLNQVGTPLSNPNSDSWRIPGVLTLKDYFTAQHTFHAVGDYTPKTGDVAFYIGRSGLDPRSKQHVNLVLSVESNTMRTIGGNEIGRMRISTQRYDTHQNSLIGFGSLK